MVLWERFGWRWSRRGQVPFNYIHLSWVTMKCCTWRWLSLAVLSRCEFTSLPNEDWHIFIKWPRAAQVGKEWGRYSGSEAAIELLHHKKLISHQTGLTRQGKQTGIRNSSLCTILNLTLNKARSKALDARTTCTILHNESHARRT